MKFMDSEGLDGRLILPGVAFLQPCQSQIITGGRTPSSNRSGSKRFCRANVSYPLDEHRRVPITLFWY